MSKSVPSYVTVWIGESEHFHHTPHSLQPNSLTPASLLSFSNCLIESSLVSMSAIMSSGAPYIYQFDLSSLHSITDKVIFNVYMFGASMNALVLGKTYGRLVVLEDRCFLGALV